MRGFASFCAAFLVVFCLLSSASAYADSRHAMLVMDVDSGKIIRQENAHEKRYPASLTKMMTLYLLFDALRKGEVKLSTKFKASKYAAKQPQTNISLRPGDKISVEDCIKALVVRSANDVAVVVAEGLGRSEWNFSVMMTQKARQLGMKNTVFRNPNGLPNPRQYTTAYDMALLGTALRHDFPQYYDYFTTNIFRYKKRTYTGHNRVIGRFGGVDGIKTGYINASGFNLVTSVKREGYYIIAVVMGGRTAAERDNEMVSLLESTFHVLEQQKDRPRAVASAPAPMLNPRRAAIELAEAQALQAQIAAANGVPPQTTPSAQPNLQVAVNTEETPQENSAPKFSVRFGGGARTRQSGGFIHESAQQHPQKVEKKAIPSFSARVRLDELNPGANKPLPPKGTLDYQLAMIQSGQGDVSYARAPKTQGKSGKNWGIQVGAFREEAQARAAVRRVFQIIQEDVSDAYITISSEGSDISPIHRARLGNFSQTEADAACRKLNALKQSCFALQMD